MPALTIRNIPETTLERLRTRAARGHRSLNGEILALFEKAAGEVPEGKKAPKAKKAESAAASDEEES